MKYDEDNKSESRIQQEIVIWFHNEFPSLRGCLCYNNNNSTGGRRAKINKFLGIIKGRSDMVLYYKGSAYMIELKTNRGKKSKAQEEWEVLMKSQGFDYFLIRSLEAFQVLVSEIMKN